MAVKQIRLIYYLRRQQGFKQQEVECRVFRKKSYIDLYRRGSREIKGGLGRLGKLGQLEY